MTAMLTHDEWRTRADRLTFATRPYIDGRPVEAHGTETIAVRDPGIGRHVVDVAAGDGEDIDRAVASARAAFNRGDWSRRAPGERKRVLLRLADLIRRDAETLALLDSVNMGKLITDSFTGTSRARRTSSSGTPRRSTSSTTRLRRRRLEIWRSRGSRSA